MAGPETTSPEIPELSVLADSVVLGLGTLMRTGARPMVPMQQGVLLCNQILAHLGPGEKSRVGQTVGGLQHLSAQIQAAFASTADAVQFFVEAREIFQQLLDPGVTVDTARLPEIQRVLVNCSMPAWRARHQEFRQRRLKRRLRRYAQPG
jgi:hypothetical protein